MKLRKPKAPTQDVVPPARTSAEDDRASKDAPNPPRTTTGWLTSPKFGNAGSGGAELEPGTDLD